MAKTVIRIRKTVGNVNNHDAVSLFEELATSFPMAAAGLIHDVCDKLRLLLDNEHPNEYAIGLACETVAKVFRPIDHPHFPDSHPWDAANERFGRWLMRGLQQYRVALIAITGWSGEQVTECKNRYTDMVRANRDDWNRAVEMLERKFSDNI